jgi:hypothetical protein
MIGASKSIWGFDPRSVPEPVVWFDASDTSTLTLSGSNVTAWRDKSRNNYNAATLIGTAPTITTINGNNAVSFISNSTLTVSNIIFTSQSRSVFTVVRSDSFMTGVMSVFVRYAPSNLDTQLGIEFGIATTSGATFLRGVSSGNISNSVSGGTNVDIRFSPAICCAVHSSVSTSNNYITVNGVTASNSASQLATNYSLNALRMYLGSSTATNLTLCEYMLYDREFTISELRQMEGYLADKWKIQTSLPLLHIHKSIKPHLTTFRPNDIPGCELWFDGADYRTMFQDTTGTTPVTSSGQSVARWTDKIRNISISNTGVPGQSMQAPTSVSGGGVFFNNTSTVVSASAQGLGTSLTGATNQTASLFKMPTRSMTMITVSYPLSNNLLRQICCIASDPIGAGNVPNFNMGHEIGAGNGGSLLFDWNGSAWGQISVSTSGYNSNTVLRIDSLIADANPIWLTNGNSNTFTQTSNYVTANIKYPVNRFAMGGYSSTFVGSRNFHGTVYEMLLYSRVLRNEERQKVEGYLANKWGLTGPSHIQTPLSIPGCSVWFDGADTTTITGTSPVTAWRDKSGNNWNATTLRGTAPTRTTVNGSNAVSFAASSTLTVSNVTFSSVQSRAIFAVYRVNTSAPNYVSWFSTQSTSNINNQGGHNNIVYPSGGGGPYLQSFAVGGAVQGVGADPAVSTIGTTAIACMIHSAVSTANNVVTLNGTSYPLTTNTLASGYGSGTVTYYIGNAYPQAYILCEYIMYQKEFTVFERKQVEGYLANKWGVTLSINDLPYRHLFRYRPVALVAPPPIHPLISLGGNNCFVVKYSSSGTPLWARRIGGPDSPCLGYSVTRDSSQNIIVGGTYTSLQMEIYGENGNNLVFTLPPPPGGVTEIFIVKYDSSGTPLWVRRIGGTNDDIVNSITTDSSGNIIVGGTYTNSSVNIYAADGTTVAFTIPQSGTQNPFLVKYDSSGTPLWARRIAGNSTEHIRSVTTDSSGNIIVTGEFFSTTLTIYAANGTTVAFTLTKIGSLDSFVVKYDSSGTPLWARKIGGTGNESATSVTTDLSGNIVVTGSYTGGLTIYAANGTTAVFTLLGQTSITDVFLVKYDSSGTPLWVVRMSSAGIDLCFSVTTDLSGNIIVFGSAQNSPFSLGAANGTFPFESNNGNFLVKYNSNGTPLWAVRIPPTVASFGSVTTDSSGNIIMTGSYGANFGITFPFSTSILAANAVNLRLVSTSQDSFVVKFNSSGTVLWVNTFGGTGTTDQARSVCTDSSENVIVTGNYNSTSLSFYA